MVYAFAVVLSIMNLFKLDRLLLIILCELKIEYNHLYADINKLLFDK